MGLFKKAKKFVKEENRRRRKFRKEVRTNVIKAYKKETLKLAKQRGIQKARVRFRPSQPPLHQFIFGRTPTRNIKVKKRKRRRKK